MAAAFDPYHKWLGIPPSEQPPTLYRLLALNPFESDPDVIEAAADARMAHLRSLQTGQHAALTQQLLNQISAAKLCLLKADKRAEYDAALRAYYAARAAQAVGPTPPPAPPPAPDESEVAAPTAGALDFATPHEALAVDSQLDPLGLHSPADDNYAGRAFVRRRKKSPWPGLFMIGAPAIGIAAVAVAILIHNSQEPGPGEDAGGSTHVVAAPNDGGDSDVPRPRVEVKTGPRPATGEPAKKVPVADEKISVYLDDLPEYSVSVGYGTLGKRGMTGYENVPQQPLRVQLGNVVAEHALSTHPPKHGAAVVSYLLERKYRSFIALAAIFDTPPLGGVGSPLEFRVLGDGHLLWSTPSPLRQPGETRRCSISIEGVKRLTLEVLCPGKNDGCHAAWIDPVVSTSPLAHAPHDNATAINRPRGGDTLQPIPRDPRDLGQPEPDPLTSSAPLPTLPTSKPPDSTPPSSKPAEAPTDARSPIPDGAAQQQALAKLKGVLKEEYAKLNTAEGRAALSQKLGKLATDEQDDPALRYVMATDGLNLAVKNGDVKLASEFVGGLCRFYRLDTWELKSKTLTQLSRTAKTPQARALVAQDSLELAGQALADDRCDLAADLAGIAIGAASAVGDNSLRDQARATRERARQQQHFADEAKAARAKLATIPADPEANLVLGRYLCLRKDNWPEGLPYLLKGSNPLWRDIAQQETDVPIAPNDQVRLADAWWDAAEMRADKKDDPWLKPMQARAVYWYRLAMPNLGGPVLIRAKTRVGESSSPSP